MTDKSHLSTGRGERSATGRTRYGRVGVPRMKAPPWHPVLDGDLPPRYKCAFVGKLHTGCGGEMIEFEQPKQAGARIVSSLTL